MLLPVAPLLVVIATADVAAAYQRGDRDEVLRLAGQGGAAAIGPMLTSADRTTVHVAIAAAPGTPDAWELLAELAELAGGWDRSLAVPAARAATRISGGLEPDLAILRDMPDDMLEARQRAWSDLAVRGDRWPDVRVAAVEVASHLAAARRATAEGDPGVGYTPADLLADPDPELRRVACELLPQPTPADLLPVLGAAVGGDTDPSVVMACAQALCADLAFDSPGPALAALGDAGAARLREVVSDPPRDAPAGALVDAARCLAARGTRDDAAALRALTAKAPKQVRSMLARAIRRSRKP